MATMQGRTTVAAGADSGNVLAGLQEELLKRPSAVRLLAVCDAILTVQPVCSFLVGDKTILDAQGIMVAQAANRITVPDDTIAKGGGAAGSRLTLRFRNADSASRIFNWRVEVQPLG